MLIFLIVITLSPHSVTKGLCVITNTQSKYSFNFKKKSFTIFKFSFDTLPNTSSKTVTFGFGNDENLLNIALKANDDIVFSYPEPELRGL